jgi:hypothetical protein
VLADARPVVDPVVADRLVGGHELHERRRHLKRAVEVAQRQQRVRVLHQALDRVEDARRALVEGRCLLEHGGTHVEGVRHHRQRALDLLRHGLELHRQLA